MWVNTVNTAISANGGTPLQNTAYWTSSEYNTYNSYCYEFHNNRYITADKNSSYRGRGVKSF